MASFEHKNNETSAALVAEIQNVGIISELANCDAVETQKSAQILTNLYNSEETPPEKEEVKNIDGGRKNRICSASKIPIVRTTKVIAFKAPSIASLKRFTFSKFIFALD